MMDPQDFSAYQSMLGCSRIENFRKARCANRHWRSASHTRGTLSFRTAFSTSRGDS